MGGQSYRDRFRRAKRLAGIFDSRNCSCSFKLVTTPSVEAGIVSFNYHIFGVVQYCSERFDLVVSFADFRVYNDRQYPGAFVGYDHYFIN
jgi:hypothetical protein